MMFFWIVTPCGLESRYQRFGEHIAFFSPEDEDSRPYVPPKHRYVPTSSHGVSTRNTNNGILTSVKT
jgi:hypothetical protein